jgi:hypothetical protein
LILGYDVGEFGGALYAMKIGENGLVTESKLLISENVSAIDQDAKGMIWIAGRRSFQGGLYSYDGKTITPIISESDLAKENVDHKVVMFDNSPRFDGVTVNSNGDVIFIAEDIGIFSHSTGNFLRSLFVGDLRVQYEMPGDIIIGSDPQGIIEKGENLYIASRSLGVFCFEKTADGNYVPIRQIIFNESHTRTPKR